MPTAFVFGGTGGVGSVIVSLLEEKGYEVSVHSKSTGTNLLLRQEGFFSGQSCDVFIYAVGLGLFNGEDLKEINRQIVLNLEQPIVLSSLIDAQQYIFIGSTAAYKGFKGHRVYCATKHGLLGLARAMRAEGKKVSVVSPGAVDTPFWAEGCGMYKPVKCLTPLSVARAVLHCIESEGCVEEMVVTP
jgi:short-subunit dehydrogenase